METVANEGGAANVKEGRILPSSSPSGMRNGDKHEGSGMGKAANKGDSWHERDGRGIETAASGRRKQWQTRGEWQKWQA